MIKTDLHNCHRKRGSKDKSKIHFWLKSEQNDQQLTQYTAFLPVSDVEAVASLLKRFLGLEELQRRRQQEEEDYGEDEEDSLGNSSDSADEREEH